MLLFKELSVEIGFDLFVLERYQLLILVLFQSSLVEVASQGGLTGCHDLGEVGCVLDFELPGSEPLLLPLLVGKEAFQLSFMRSKHSKFSPELSPFALTALNDVIPLGMTLAE